MGRPTISICIATYNQDRYLRKCIHSVVEQEVDADLEILVGDDGSSDGTPAILAELVSQSSRPIRVLRSPNRLGASFNMQRLLGLSTGDYVARLDGDDYWLPGKLACQLRYLRENEECVAVYTNAVAVDDSGHEIGVFNDAGDAVFDLAGLIRRGNFLNNSSSLLRACLKEPWLALEGPLLDYRVHLLHARSGPIGHIGRPLVAYRVASAGSLVTHDNDNVRQLYWEAVNSIPRHMISDEDFAAGIADFYRRVMFRALATRRFSLARKWWENVRDASPFGRSKTLGLVAGSCLRAGSMELAGWVSSRILRSQSRVLCRR